jgi:hypothetical protein
MDKTGGPIPATNRPVSLKPTSHRNTSDPIPALSQMGFFLVRRVVRPTRQQGAPTMPLFETGLIIACAVALAPWAVMACPGS